MEEYYVYKVYVEGTLRYVGKGKGMRYKHAVSGRSSSVQLNRDYLEGKGIQVKLFKWGLSSENALKEEDKLISENFDSLYNKMKSISSRDKATLPKASEDREDFAEVVRFISKLHHKYQKAVGALYLCKGELSKAKKVLIEGFLRDNNGVHIALSWYEAEGIMNELYYLISGYSDDKITNYFEDLISLPTSKNIQGFFNEVSLRYSGRTAL